MKLCSIAWFVLFFSILGIITDMYLFGIPSLFGISINVTMSLFFIWLANWACFKQGYNWVAWTIVIFSAIGIAITFYIIKNKSSNSDILLEIEKQKKDRKKYGL